MLFCRRKRYGKRKSHLSKSCFRRPLVVFLLSFLAIGSLRFRTRTKRVAKSLISRHHMHSKRTMLNYQANQLNPNLIEYTVTKPEQLLGLRGKQPSPDTVFTMKDWAESIVSSKGFAKQFISLLEGLSFQAIFFETPGMTSQSFSRAPAQFVVVNAPQLAQFAQTGNPQAFSSHFQPESNSPAVVFSNLGNDAVLISPVPFPTRTHRSEKSKTIPSSDSPDYGHLLSFLRSKENEDAAVGVIQSAFQAWRDRAVQPNNDNNPFWFSTSGMGVAWLHFRVDSTPKYYTYAPYKSVGK